MEWNYKLLKSYEKLGEKVFLRDFLIEEILSEDTPENTSDFIRPYIVNNGEIVHGLRAPNVSYRFSRKERKTFNDVKDDILKIEDFLSFLLYEYQKEMLSTVSNNRLSIFNISRQIGSTTAIALHALHYSMFNKNKVCLILCPDVLSCKDFYDSIYKLYLPLPFFIKRGIANTKSGKKIVFDNGSQILFGTDPENFLMLHIDNLILQDLAFNKKQSNIGNLLVTRLSSIKDGRVIIFSGPSSDSNSYISNIFLNNNSFFKKTYKWSVTSRSEDWKKEIIRQIGLNSFAREYECLIPNTKEYNRFVNLNYLTD